MRNRLLILLSAFLSVSRRVLGQHNPFLSVAVVMAEALPISSFVMRRTLLGPEPDQREQTRRGKTTREPHNTIGLSDLEGVHFEESP